MPTEVKGNAMCYLGTATAINNPEVSEAPVIIMAATQADLEQFMRGAGLEIVNEDWFYPVALLHQKDVKVVDDL